MKKHNFKSVISLFVALVMLTSAFATSAFAAILDPLVDPSEEVTLTVHKYDVPNEDKTQFQEGDGELLSPGEVPSYSPLADVTFSAYLVTEFNKDELKTFVGKTTVPDDSFTPAETVVTDALGEAIFTQLQQARYLVVEVSAPDKVVEKTANFMVDLPYTNKDMTTWNYNVHVYPKNYTVLGSVELTKTIDSGSMPAGLFAKFELQQYINGRYTTMSQYADLRTDDDGKIRVDGLIKGQYQFVETVAPVGYGINSTPIKFEITKNTAEEVVAVSMDNNKLPKIEKSVSVDGGSSYSTEAGASLNQNVKWRIVTDVPSDIHTYSTYLVRDVLDTKLDYVENSISVVAYSDSVSMKELVKDVDYKLSIDKTSNTTLNVEFIGDNFLGGRTSLKDFSAVEITFDTTINDNAIMGQDIPNESVLVFNNGYMPETKTVTSNEPHVHTGGVKLVKVDSTDVNKTLQGAEFAIFATEEDALAGINAINTAVSDADGKFEFKGLAYGALGEINDSASRDYWVVETKAPAGYHLSKAPIMVTVNKDSYSDQTTAILVKNALKPNLPLTGGQGTLMFLIIGVAFVGFSAILFKKYRSSAKAK